MSIKTSSQHFFMLLLLLLAFEHRPQLIAAAAAAGQSAANSTAGPLNATALPVSASVPFLNLTRWNEAFVLTVRGVPPTSAVVTVPPGCLLNSNEKSRELVQPSEAPLNSCFYTTSSYARPTHDWFRKLPGDLRSLSNSYCYALNVFKGGPCIPGTANGTDKQLYPGHTNCSILRAALAADGLQQISRQMALTEQPKTGHFIAVLVRTANGSSSASSSVNEGVGVGWLGGFAAIRKDNNSRWSYKVDLGPAFDRDLLNNTITDPEKAFFFGHFNTLCGYHVQPDKVVIGGLFEPSVLQQTFRTLKAAADAAAKNLPEKQQSVAITVDLTPSPYNASTDAAQSSLDQLAWDAEKKSISGR